MKKCNEFSLDILDAGLQSWINLKQQFQFHQDAQSNLRSVATQSPNSLYHQIFSLFHSAFKQVFVFHSDQMMKTEYPNYQVILDEISNDLADRKILLTQLTRIQLSPQLYQFITVEVMKCIQILINELRQMGGAIVEVLVNNNQNIWEESDSINEKQSCTELARTTSLLFNERLKTRLGQYFRISCFNQLRLSVIVSCWKLTQILNECGKKLQNHLDTFTLQYDKIQFPNRFLLTYLLKELSKECFEVVRKEISNSFISQLDPIFQEELIDFIIKNGESFDFESYSNEINEAFPSIDILQEQTNYAIQICNESNIKSQFQLKIQRMGLQSDEKINYRRVIRNDGHHGIILRIKDSHEFLVHINGVGQITILSVKFISNKWEEYIFTEKSQNKNPSEILKINETEITYSELNSSKIDELLQFIVKSSDVLPKNLIKIPLKSSKSTNFLGECLVNINQCKTESASLGKFGFVLEKDNNLQLAVQQLPIIGDLITLGKFSVSTFELTQNEVANSQNKLSKMGKISFAASSQLGGSFSGALIGQAVIPIPGIGALIGGAIGGLLASFSSNYAIKKMNKSKFENLIEEIQQKIEIEGFWKNSEDMCIILGINRDFLFSSIPQKLLARQPDIAEEVWITMCCFAILSIFYGSKEEKAKRDMENEWKKNNTSKSNMEIEKEIEKLQQWNKAVLMSHQWLTNLHIPFSQYLEQVEQFISQFVSQA